MNRKEITVYTNKEALEPLSGVLMQMGISSIVVEDPDELKAYLEDTSDSWDMLDENLSEELTQLRPNIKFYISDDKEGRELLGKVQQKLKQLKSDEKELFAQTETAEQSIADDDWQYNWREFFKAFGVGEKLYVKPVWDECPCPSERTEVLVNPGSSFGSGLHETTRLCLMALERYAPEANEIVDVGCGSGILSVAAAKLGAKHVVAVDIDANAVDATAECAEVNGVADKITAYTGDLLSGAPAKADVVVANIFAGSICELASQVKSVLSEGGIFISSGIIKERLEEVIDAYKQNGIELLNTENIGSWYALVGRV